MLTVLVLAVNAQSYGCSRPKVKWKWVVGTAGVPPDTVRLLISLPVIVVSTWLGCRPKEVAFVSFELSVGKEICEAEIVLPAEI